MRGCHYSRLICFQRNLIQANSRFGPRANPNFYRVDVALYSPPGSYYFSNFHERTAEVLKIESLVRAHATPVRSIHDITESLASDLLANFPAAIETSITFQPDIQRNFKIENLVRADCSFSKFNTRTKCTTAEQDSIYQVVSEWHLPSPLQSGRVISLVLKSEERSVSTVYDQISGLESTSCGSSLHYVHPTFHLHEEVARFAEQRQSDRAESAALLLAQFFFHLADVQSPCKRLQHVSVHMRDVPPLIDSRTRRELLVTKMKRKFNNDPITSCQVQLRRPQYEHSLRGLLSSDVQSGRHRAYLALGSNLGDRVEMIELAVREMNDRGLAVLRTSALYETKPMYLENQESFINGACEVCSTDGAANHSPGDVDMARLKHH